MNKWIILAIAVGVAYWYFNRYKNPGTASTVTKKPQSIRDIKDADNQDLMNDAELTDAEFWDLIEGNDSEGNLGSGNDSGSSVSIEYIEPQPLKSGTVSSSGSATNQPIPIQWVDPMPRISNLYYPQ